MADAPRLSGLAHALLYLLIFAVVLFLRLLPLDTGGRPWPMPDLVLALTIAWVLRRPAHLPAPLIGLAYLAEDLFTLRPPGLWALIVLGATEFLRRRQAVAREITLTLEWALVAGVLLAMTLLYRLVLAIVMVAPPPLDLSLMGLGLTILSYPLVVLVLHFVLRIRKPAPGELDELGRRM